MITTKTPESHGFKIGAVSRMTGIAPDTLRIWERRYEIVTPERTPAGGRLYSQEQINRLTLIKNLVDAGDSISVVASLSLADLQNRLTATTHAAATPSAISERPCRLVILGESLGLNLKQAIEQMDSMTITGSYTSVSQFESELQSLKADVLLIEMPTVHEDSASRIIEWLELSGAIHVILVYRFGNVEAIRRIPLSKCSTLRAPVDVHTIKNLCQSLFGAYKQVGADEEESLYSVGEIATPRKYDDETLARVAMQSTVIKCECPRHLTELISGLAAFERYSTECESRSPADAELHTFLNITASRARVMIENALSRVIETENIKI